LAVEADTRLGGFAQNLTEAGYDFDLGLHVIMSLGSKGPFGQGMLHAVLEQLGVEAELEHVALDPFYAVRLEDEQVVLPGDTRRALGGARGAWQRRRAKHCYALLDL
jgi:phytoene dehydrogenase-like protein